MPATVNHSGLLEGGFCIATRVRGGAVTPLHRALSITQLFCVHSFVRPTSSELYALKHNDITVERDPKRLLVTVRNGKTGYRVANTMSGAVQPLSASKPAILMREAKTISSCPNIRTERRHRGSSSASSIN